MHNEIIDLGPTRRARDLCPKLRQPSTSEINLSFFSFRASIPWRERCSGHGHVKLPCPNWTGIFTRVVGFYYARREISLWKTCPFRLAVGGAKRCSPIHVRYNGNL